MVWAGAMGTDIRTVAVLTTMGLAVMMGYDSVTYSSCDRPKGTTKA